MKDNQPTPQLLDAKDILKIALDLAQEQKNWYDLSFVELADRCGISVEELYTHFSDTNAIADAWFTQALKSMLIDEKSDGDNNSTKYRLATIIWRWFKALSPYHQVTTQMLKAKLHLPHIHHWVPMAFNLSALVQLWRDMAGLHAAGRRRQVEEVVLTGIFLVTLSAWCRDKSPQQTQAHSRLMNLLDKAEQAGQI